VLCGTKHPQITVDNQENASKTCVDEQATGAAKVKLVKVGHNSNWCAYTERRTVSQELKRKQRQHLLEEVEYSAHDITT
jgi:hypothetical protein